MACEVLGERDTALPHQACRPGATACKPRAPQFTDHVQQLLTVTRWSCHLRGHAHCQTEHPPKHSESERGGPSAGLNASQRKAPPQLQTRPSAPVSWLSSSCGRPMRAARAAAARRSASARSAARPASAPPSSWCRRRRPLRPGQVGSAKPLTTSREPCEAPTWGAPRTCRSSGARAGSARAPLALARVYGAHCPTVQTGTGA